MRRTILLAVVAICLVSMERSAHAQATKSRSADMVVVTIRPDSVVNDEVVLLSDVTRIETRNQELKSRIESLDIADSPKSGESAVISASLIEFRLRLAGIDVRRVTIRGQSGEVSARDLPVDGEVTQGHSQSELMLARAAVSLPRRSSSAIPIDVPRKTPVMPQRGVSIRTDEEESRSCEEIIVCAARRCVLGQLPWGEDEINIRLVQPISRDVEAIENARSCVFTAELHSPGPPMGRVQIEATVERADHTTTMVPVVFDVRHYDSVVATRKPLPKGREIQLEDLYVHRWDVSGSADYSTDPQKLVGKIVKRPISALQIIRDQDVETPGTGVGQGQGLGLGQGKAEPFVIKRQDRVKMTAKIGDLTITVSGQAQQDGRVGDTIRVQNVESKSIVQGRVLGPNEVEITD